MFKLFLPKMLTVREGLNRSRTRENAVFLDVRPREEFQKSHIADTVNIPFDKLETEAPRRFRDKETEIYVVGSYTYKPKKAARLLYKLGFKTVIPSGYMEQHYGLMTNGR